MKIDDIRSKKYRHTNLENEIDGNYPKTTWVEVVGLIAMGVVVAGFIYWMITVGH